MWYGIRLLAALGLVALLVPVAAVAKDARVQGPTAIAGAGYFAGELGLAMEAFLPEGAGGSWHGRFVTGDGDREGERPRRAPKPAEETDEVPALDDLAGMLDEVEG